MDILLISTNRSRTPFPVMPAGACLVADAAARAGHRVQLLDLMFVKDPAAALTSALGQFRPEVVGLSVRNIDNSDMLSPCGYTGELARMARLVGAAGIPRVLGGAAAAIMPEPLLRLTGADWVVTGPGELVFPRLLQALAEGKRGHELPGIGRCVQDGYLHTPFRAVEGDPGPAAPDFRRWLDLAAYAGRLSTAPLRTKSGCPFRCTYCSYPLIETWDNSRTAGEICAAVLDLAAQGIHDVEFVDSVFNVPYRPALELCQALARTAHGTRLHCLELSPSGLDSRLLHAMVAAGFVSIGMTVESASDQVLQALNKGFTRQELDRASTALAELPIPCAWIFMLGGPGESGATVAETLEFAKRHVRPRDVAFFTIGIRIYPGTRLEEIARSEGQLSGTPDRLLEPLFYFSPLVGRQQVEDQVRRVMATRMNFISIDALGHSCLPALNRLAALAGLAPPLWKYGRFIRRCLRLAGMDR